MTDERRGLNPKHVSTYLDSWFYAIEGGPGGYEGAAKRCPLYRRAIIASYNGANETAAAIIEVGFFGIDEDRILARRDV